MSMRTVSSREESTANAEEDKSSEVAVTPRVIVSYKIGDAAEGVYEKIANIGLLTVVAKDYDRVLRAEYLAGMVQGHLEAAGIRDARDNLWDLTYLLNPDNKPGPAPAPTEADMAVSTDLLCNNYDSFINTLRTWSADPAKAADATALKRLLFRMLGIYHGARTSSPQPKIDFSGAWLPDKSFFAPAERELNYKQDVLSFMDVYFINASNDLGDVKSHIRSIESSYDGGGEESCSAFLKRTRNGIILTHNTWQGFLSQTMATTMAVNDDLVSYNASSPGLIGSGTDFGFNNKGLMFNETTHRLSRNEARANGMWIFWRAAAAEHYAANLDEFFHYLTLDNSATYLNGYMVADVKNGESGLIEMSYRCFVCFRSSGGPYKVTGWSLDGGPCSLDYDAQMVTPEYLMGINFPASLQVREDLQSTDNRPARRRQFAELLPGVVDIATARRAITYTDPANPLSIFGRWDLGWGETLYPKTIPDGSVDAKVVGEASVKAFMDLEGILDQKSLAKGFWMLFGTPHMGGKPFVWSESPWRGQTLRDVPDRLDGAFVEVPLNLR